MKPESSMGEAESVFAEYRRRVESGETVDLEALCARRPEIADELKFLESICVVGDRAGKSSSFRQFLESRFGPGAVDRFALASDTSEVPGPGAPAAAAIEPTVAGVRGDTPAGVPRSVLLVAGASGRYTIEEKIAEGGMGVIYRVFDRNLRRTLAMKVQKLPIRPAARPADSPSPKDDTHRFLEEAHVTAQLDHPGIVPVHELGLSAENQTYFTMALVRGRSLKEILEAAREGREGWNRARAVGVIVKVCQAVAYAHNKGIVHRDLKPDNVMVGRFGEVYVLDWGLAKVRGEKDRHDLRPRLETGEKAADAADSTDAGGSPGATTRIGSDSPVVTMDGTVMGTPAFMPPEQAAGRLDEVDERSDVYALGAMLYQLLTGQVPYLEPGERIAPQILLLRVLDGPPRPVGEVVSSAPPELVAICDKAMARESSGRYSTGLELAEDLQAYLDHRVVRAYESGRWAELKKWCSRHRGALRAVAGVGLFLIAAATFVGWFLRVQQAEDLIASGREHLTEYRRLQGASAALHARWVEARQTVSWLPVWYRRQELETHGRLAATRREIDELHAAATRDFSNARELAPILSGVRRVAVAQLGDVYGERYRDILDGEVFPEVPELYLERIRKLGLAARREELDPHGRVRIGSVPPGAGVYCFRYIASSESPLLPLPFDSRAGELCGGPFLRIARIWAAERHQGIFAAGDRIVSVRGRAVSSRTELVAAVEDIAEDQAVDVVVRREGEEKSLRWIPFASGLRMSDATVRVPEIRLRFGFTLEGYPLDFADRCLAGRTDEETPLSVALPRGSYLLVLRRPGYRDTRLPLVVPSEEDPPPVRLFSEEQIPPGFVHVPAGAFAHGGDPFAFQGLDAGDAGVPDYFMARLEVTIGEYLEFINDPEINGATDDGGEIQPRSPPARDALARIDPGKTRIRIVPELEDWILVRESPGKPWVVDEARSRRKRGLQAPAAGMSQLAALEYAHWRSRKDERWGYRLPTDLEWEKAARGVDRRVHVWGNYLVWAFARSAGGIYPSSYYPLGGGQAPIDESVYGVLDLGGSMSEHTSSSISLVNTTLRGANWWATDTQNMRCATRNGRKSDGAGSEAGIRLVAERIGEED